MEDVIYRYFFPFVLFSFSFFIIRRKKFDSEERNSEVDSFLFLFWLFDSKQLEVLSKIIQI